MEYKPCPFCGSKLISMYSNYSRNAKAYFVWIECDTCGARSKATSQRTSPEDSNWRDMACQKVLSLWNMRATAARRLWDDD